MYQRKKNKIFNIYVHIEKRKKKKYRKNKRKNYK